MWHLFLLCAGAPPPAPTTFLTARGAPPPLASLALSRSREPQALRLWLGALIRRDFPLSQHCMGPPPSTCHVSNCSRGPTPARLARAFALARAAGASPSARRGGSLRLSAQSADEQEFVRTQKRFQIAAPRRDGQEFLRIVLLRRARNDAGHHAVFVLLIA